MDYRLLGHSGVRVSAIGLGTNHFGSKKVPPDDVKRIIGVALDSGINFIDTADVYQEGRSEITVGEALKGRRDQVVLATKFSSRVGEGPNDGDASRYHCMNAVEASLRRLQTDHIDLYFVHWWDENTPIEETLRAMDDLVRTGKVRYLGASNYASWQLAHANLLAEVRGWTPFVVVENHYHMLERGAEREMLPYCQAHDVGFVPYFPLAGGFLTGKYKKGQSPPPGSRSTDSTWGGYVKEYMADANFDVVQQLTSWAAARDRGMNELAHAWLLAQPRVCSVISGATKPEHILANAKAGDWALSADEMEEVDAILSG